ncbi:MAG TPA: hypothetical protein PLB87_07855 [Prolixibacteraceae bacterium]|nr:hypothetical protein [Prolixibacteraceae bacterium]
MKYIGIFIFLLLPFCTKAQEKPRVVASTSWTAAYVRAAGVSNVVQLAPSMMEHPSEYELQIGDMEKIKKADLIVYAGYETVISQIQQSLKIDPSKFIKIETSYVESQIRSEVMKIAEKANTVKAAQLSLDLIHRSYGEAKMDIEKNGLKDKPVIVHFFQSGFAKEVGLKPVAVFGPSPLESYDLSKLLKSEAVMIIDNRHNPIAQPLSEMKKGVKTVELLNFPGMGGTQSIEDVIRFNTQKLIGK